MNLTPHFTLKEFIRSQTAERLGINNDPDIGTIAELTETAQLLEQVRELLKCPVHVDSGYRCPALNRIVGGSLTSAHLWGGAVDFIVPGISNFQVALIVRGSKLVYDQLILEYGWVHLGRAQRGSQPRRQNLTKRSASSPYEMGINP